MAITSIPAIQIANTGRRIGHVLLYSAITATTNSAKLINKINIFSLVLFFISVTF